MSPTSPAVDSLPETTIAAGEFRSVTLLVVDRAMGLISPAQRDAATASLLGRLDAAIRRTFASGQPALGIELSESGAGHGPVVASVLPLALEGATVQRVQILVHRAGAGEAMRHEGERARAQLAAIVESAQDAIVSKDLDGIVQSWNRSAERMFGYCAQEMIGRSITTIIPPERLDEERYILDRIRSGGRVERYETVRRRKDGRDIAVWITVSPVRDSSGRIIGASKIAQAPSERQAAQEALRRREEELKIITDAVPALISYIDADLRYRFNNRAYERWFGQARDSLHGRHMRDVLGEAAFEAIRPYAERALAGETVRFETWADYRDGGRRYIDATYLPRRNGVGQVEGLFVLVSDLTDRKQAEERLRESEARHRTLIDSLSDAIVLADEKRRIALVNPAFTKVFGYSPEEAIGRPTEILYVQPEDYRRLGRERYNAAAGPEVAAYEIQYRRKDGTVFWAETRGSAIRGEEGDLIGYLGIHRDITARKEAENALRESEARFRLMTETIPDMVFTNRPDGACEYVNSRWHEYTGAPPDAAAGFGWLDMVHPEDRANVLQSWQASVRIGRAFEGKFRLRGSDGRYRWNIARSRPLVGGDGSIRKWLGVCTDIDDLVQAQQALRESHRRKDEFLAMLAHELRNPLAPILTAVEVLQMQPELLQGKVAWATEIIQRQTQHLTHLVDDLLDIARIVSGRIQLRWTTTDVREIAARAAENIRRRAEAEDLRLHVQLTDEPLRVRADTARITQILDNLLDNAVKYTDAGGAIWLGLARDGDQAVFTVRDTGIGIAADHITRIFELFEQAEPGFDRSQGGLGLGLNLVQRLVSMHGGSVEAHSKGRGCGSEFIVRLPLAGSAGTLPEDRARGRPGSDAPRRVLIVEDNPDIAEALTTLLRTMGHKTRAVADGPACLEAVARERPDVVLLDLGLPGMNGYEVAETLRARYPDSALRLIALTGYGREEDRRRSEAAGFDHHMVKPVDQDALDQLLRGCDP